HGLNRQRFPKQSAVVAIARQHHSERCGLDTAESTLPLVVELRRDIDETVDASSEIDAKRDEP
ncbi:MAG: hypothetical protein ACREBN_03800, partial [Burkholderiaceae bacterium]